MQKNAMAPFPVGPPWSQEDLGDAVKDLPEWAQ